MSTADALPQFADLHLLTVLAQTRSYTAAARRLGISKASVSMRIAELERAAGVPLVRRTTRSVGLTEAGSQLVDDVQAAFAQIEHGFGRVRDQADHPRGLVRVTAPVALGRQHIAPTLAAFVARFPEIRIDLDLSDRLVNLAQEGFDLAIRHAEAPPDTHVAWTLCDTRSLLVASPAYLQRRGLPRHPRELAGHDCLLYLRPGGSESWAFEPAVAAPAATRARAALSRARRQANGRTPEATAVDGPVVVPVRGPLRANNSEVLREAALDGLGIGLLPDFSVGAHLARGALVPLLPGWRPHGYFGERIFAIRPWAPRVPRAVQCFVEHLREALAGGFGVAAR